MKAAVLHGMDQELTLEEVPKPEAGPGEAIVQIRAAALNHRDVWIRKGQYAGLQFPIILGSDAAGTVTDVGDEPDREWLGRDVVINPGLHWGADPRAHNPETFQILGLPQNGTLAEFVKVPAESLFVKPDHLSWAETSALPLTGVTAYRALTTQGELQPEQTVLVTGTGGGVASIALVLATALGARVWVTSGSDEKLAEAQRHGAAGGANYRSAGWAKQLREPSGGFDLIIDSAGGEGFPQLLEAAKPGGRLVTYGATRGNPPTLDLRRVFWKQLTLRGTFMGTPEEFGAMLDLVADRQLRPIVDCVLPFSQIKDAFSRLESSSQFGKIVLTPGG